MLCVECTLTWLSGKTTWATKHRSGLDVISCKCSAAVVRKYAVMYRGLFLPVYMVVDWFLTFCHL